jgi:hypothetical protein
MRIMTTDAAQILSFTHWVDNALKRMRLTA